MKRFFVLCLLVAFAFSLPQLGHAQGNPEAVKLAREGTQAAKDQDWDKAIEALRKATELDHKYAPNLAAALQQRATVAANERRFPEAIADFTDAIKVSPKDAGIYERRAAVEMKMNDLTKAMADYSEAIKLNPNEIRYYLYRGYVFESQGDLQNALADTEKVLKLDKKNAEALARKKRIEERLKQQQANQPPGQPAPTKAPH
jgi:tetratricopeptide (TPR) repeat protein